MRYKKYNRSGLSNRSSIPYDRPDPSEVPKDKYTSRAIDWENFILARSNSTKNCAKRRGRWSIEKKEVKQGLTQAHFHSAKRYWAQWSPRPNSNVLKYMSIFLFLKFYNFIKGITLYILFLKNLRPMFFILHLFINFLKYL